MDVLFTILSSIFWSYLAIGFFYALYILLYAGDEWYWFPVNMIFGPVYLVFLINSTRQGKRPPIY